jgi:cytochrome c553
MRPDEHPVSVIIPTTGRPTLNRCLEALEGQIRPTDEVIVSEDLNRCGVSWARKKGVQRSHGDLIAFTDNDCVPPGIGWNGLSGLSIVTMPWEQAERSRRRIRFSARNIASEGVPRRSSWIPGAGWEMEATSRIAADVSRPASSGMETFSTKRSNSFVKTLNLCGACDGAENNYLCSKSRNPPMAGNPLAILFPPVPEGERDRAMLPCPLCEKFRSSHAET